jgi:hypothetical protein
VQGGDARQAAGITSLAPFGELGRGRACPSGDATGRAVLENALEAVPGAAANFAALSASTRKMVLFWLASAKRPETRQKRLEQIVAAAAQNRNPLDLPPPCVL